MTLTALLIGAEGSLLRQGMLIGQQKYAILVRLQERFGMKTNYGFVLPKPAIVVGFAGQAHRLHFGGIRAVAVLGALALIAFLDTCNGVLPQPVHVHGKGT